LCVAFAVAYTDGNGYGYSNSDRYDHGHGDTYFDAETDAYAAGSTDAETRSDTGATPDDQADLPLANAVSLELHAAFFGNSQSNSRVPEKRRALYLRARQAKDERGPRRPRRVGPVAA
jgi:hypothetical protein